MITSPTVKGIVIIGGEIDEEILEVEDCSSNALLELSIRNSSKGDLSWAILEQKLQYPKSHHVSFYVPEQMVTDLNNLKSGNK